MVVLTVSARGVGGRTRVLCGVLRPSPGAVEGDRSADFGGFGTDLGVEVFAAEPVAVAFEADRISEWWISRSIMAVAAMSSPKISPHLLNGLFEVTIIEARS